MLMRVVNGRFRLMKAELCTGTHKLRKAEEGNPL
jgi:hypothetical protein